MRARGKPFDRGFQCFQCFQCFPGFLRDCAAGRIRALPLPVIAQRLKQRLASLRWAAQDLPERQQTLRATGLTSGANRYLEKDGKWLKAL